MGDESSLCLRKILVQLAFEVKHGLPLLHRAVLNLGLFFIHGFVGTFASFPPLHQCRVVVTIAGFLHVRFSNGVLGCVPLSHGSCRQLVFYGLCVDAIIIVDHHAVLLG